MEKIYGLRATRSEVLAAVNKYLTTFFKRTPDMGGDDSPTAEFDMDEDDEADGCFFLCINNVSSMKEAEALLNSLGEAGEDTLDNIESNYTDSDVLHLHGDATNYLIGVAFGLSLLYILAACDGNDNLCLIERPGKQMLFHLPAETRAILSNAKRMTIGEHRVVAGQFDDGIEMSIHITATGDEMPSTKVVLAKNGCAVRTANITGRASLFGEWCMDYIDTTYIMVLE